LAIAADLWVSSVDFPELPLWLVHADNRDSFCEILSPESRVGAKSASGEQARRTSRGGRRVPFVTVRG
jgi:hypothetical protein